MHGGPISARPNKSVVMIFGRGRAAVPQFHVGEHGVAHVRNYAYLRVTLHGLRHVDELLRGGNAGLQFAVFRQLQQICRRALNLLNTFFNFMFALRCVLGWNLLMAWASFCRGLCLEAISGPNYSLLFTTYNYFHNYL